MRTINFKKLHPDAIAPKSAKLGDAGYDLFSTERIIINPLERKLVSTGIAVEIPEGFYGRIAPRSGLAIKNGIDVLAGVIDSGYRNEIKVVLINFAVIGEFLNDKDPLAYYFNSQNAFIINPGDRIAQLIIEPYEQVIFAEVGELSSSDRNLGGFGSTGK